MTTELKYEAIAQAIRQEFPRLMEMEEGTLIQNVYTNQIFKIYNVTETHYRMYELNSELPNEISLHKNIMKKHSDYIIIGKELMLSDILEWISKLKDKVSFEIDTFFMYKHISNVSGWEFYKHTKWDLSKPYLKEQSKELINFLYELIDK